MTLICLDHLSIAEECVPSSYHTYVQLDLVPHCQYAIQKVARGGIGNINLLTITASDEKNEPVG